MKTDKNSKWTLIYKAYKYLGLVPIIWTLATIIYYLIVSLTIGHFPSYSNPDPADLKNELLKFIGSTLLTFFLISIYCLYIFIVLFIIHLTYILIKKDSLIIKRILYSAFGFLTLIGMMIIPGLNKILEWLLD